jgi:diadenosine tetraphosphate (Ap4A) HIT family hydrolase
MYKESCEGCKLSRGHRKSTGGIIELDGDWILNHYGGAEGFLGWMTLQPRQHRMDLADLEPKEIIALGGNVQLVDKALRDYWNEKFPNDPIKRVYLVYFFESVFSKTEEEWHMHIHLIPRTRELGTDRRHEYKPWEVAAWKIAQLSDKFWFPPQYRIRDRNGQLINEGEVVALMEYLKEFLASTS